MLEQKGRAPKSSHKIGTCFEKSILHSHMTLWLTIFLTKTAHSEVITACYSFIKKDPVLQNALRFIYDQFCLSNKRWTIKTVTINGCSAGPLSMRKCFRRMLHQKIAEFYIVVLKYKNYDFLEKYAGFFVESKIIEISLIFVNAQSFENIMLSNRILFTSNMILSFDCRSLLCSKKWYFYLDWKF